MPATRLRNQDWQRSLQQVCERGGSLDVAIATGAGGDEGKGANILWRVRLLKLSGDAIFVEQPIALGQPIDLQKGVMLVVILTIGQNRWMFPTTNLGVVAFNAGGGRFGDRPTFALRLAMPQTVERCQRRANYRVSTAALRLPEVDAWPLLDPATVLIAERANELEFNGTAMANEREAPEELRLPKIGPHFHAQLVNLGGGGVGLSVPIGESQSLLHHKLFWLRIKLPPVLKSSICATAKVVHTHLSASQEYYAGMAFDFTFNPTHEKFVVEQIGRYVAVVQREQTLKQSA
jgi:hypothetical protein